MDVFHTKWLGTILAEWARNVEFNDLVEIFNKGSCEDINNLEGYVESEKNLYNMQHQAEHVGVVVDKGVVKINIMEISW